MVEAQVDLVEARLYRQDMQIQKLMEDVDALNTLFVEIRGRMEVALADRDDLVDSVLHRIGMKFQEMTGIYG